MLARSCCGVSPVRTSVRMSTSGRPSACKLLRGYRRVARPGSSGCRSTAPSAAIRRRRTSRRRSAPSLPFAHQRIDRGRGTRRASCPSPSAPRSARSRPRLDQRPRARLRLGRRLRTARRTMLRRRDGRLPSCRHFRIPGANAASQAYALMRAASGCRIMWISRRRSATLPSCSCPSTCRIAPGDRCAFSRRFCCCSRSRPARSLRAGASGSRSRTTPRNSKARRGTRASRATSRCPAAPTSRTRRSWSSSASANRTASSRRISRTTARTTRRSTSACAALGLRTYTPEEIRSQIAQAEIDAYFRNDPDAALSASRAPRRELHPARADLVAGDAATR